jgi:hypothetical protein
MSPMSPMSSRGRADGIAELEAELEAVKAASALFEGKEPVRPKDSA